MARLWNYSRIGARPAPAGPPIRLAAMLALLLLVPFAPARATVVFTTAFVDATTGNTVSVEADMSISGNTLTIVLANTSPSTTADPGEVLTGFLFDLAGQPTLAYASASGYTVNVGKTPDQVSTSATSLKATGSTNKGRWAFASGFSNTNALLASYGLATAPFTGAPDSFPTAQTGSNSASALNYGIDAASTGVNKADVSGVTTFTYQTATFTLSGVAGLTEASIQPVATFVFGAVSPNFVTAVLPEPPSLALPLLALALLLPRWKSRRRPARRRYPPSSASISASLKPK